MKLGDNKPTRLPIHTPTTQDDHSNTGMIVVYGIVAISAALVTIAIYSLALAIFAVSYGSR